MLKLIQFLGFMLILQGISGVISVVLDKPDFGFFLNVFNRQILSRIDALAGWYVAADIAIIALGVAIILLAEHRKVPA